MAAIPNNDAWKKFFEVLKSLPALWKIKDDTFKNKNEKKQAWEKLYEEYKKIDPNASLNDLKKKLINIKSCYRREVKKIETSEKSGTSSETVHVPSLWYFDCVDFLRDQERQMPGLSTIDLSEENVIVETAIEATELPSSSTRRRKKNISQHIADRNELLRTTISNMQGSAKEDVVEDEAEIYAKSWAASFRKLSGTQRIYAKKAFEDILVLGQLDQLTLNSISMAGSSRSSTPASTSHYSSVNISLQEIPTGAETAEPQIVLTYQTAKDLFSDNTVNLQ